MSNPFEPNLPPPPRVSGPGNDPNAAERARAQYVAQLALPGFAQLQAIAALIGIILSWWSVSLEVFLRRDFGERYFSFTRVFMGFVIMGSSAGLGQLGALASGNVLSQLGGFLFFQALYFGFMIAAVVHLVRIWRRNRQGIAWYSMSFGVSWLSFLPVQDWVLYRLIEPGLCFVVGVLVSFGSGAAGGWIIIAAIALFIKNNIAYNQARAIELDMLDAQIVSQYLQPARHGAPKSKTAGYSAVSLPFTLDRNQDGIPDAVQRPGVVATPPQADYSADLSDILGDTAANVPAAAVAATPVTPQADYSADLGEIFGEKASPPTVPLPNQGDASRPFDTAVPIVSPQAGNGTATTPALLPIVARYWPVAAGIVALLVVALFASSFFARRGPLSNDSPNQGNGQPVTGGFVADALTATSTSQPTFTPIAAVVQFQSVPPTATNAPTATPIPTEPPATATSTPTQIAAAPLPADQITVSSRNTAPNAPGACQDTISYDPNNVTDGDPATAWRTLGDGTGASLRLTFAAPVQVTEVQIYTGYGKIDTCQPRTDRWPLGFRASIVELRFSDGTTEQRNLADVRGLQSLSLTQPVRAEWVEITIKQTRPPLTTGAPNPYAAISDVVVIGAQQ